MTAMMVTETNDVSEVKSSTLAVTQIADGTSTCGSCQEMLELSAQKRRGVTSSGGESLQHQCDEVHL